MVEKGLKLQQDDNKNYMVKTYHFVNQYSSSIIILHHLNQPPYVYYLRSETEFFKISKYEKLPFQIC